MIYSSENNLTNKFTSSFEDAVILSENNQILDYKLVFLSHVTLNDKLSIRAKIIEIRCEERFSLILNNTLELLESDFTFRNIDIILLGRELEYFIVAKENSSLTFWNCSFKEKNWVHWNNFKSILYVTNSTLHLSSCLILDLDILFGNFLIMQDNKDHAFNFFDSKIINLKENSTSIGFKNDLFAFKTLKFFNINSIIIFNNILERNLFYLNDIDNITINNCDINSNLIQGHILEIFVSNNFTMNSVYYRNNNKFSNYQNMHNFDSMQWLSGGMLRSVQSKYRSISKVFVLDSFSYSRTIGIKIIDTRDHFYEYEITIEDSVFFNNVVQCSRFDEETGVSIFIDSVSRIYLINSLFENNDIQLEFKSTFLGNSPCIRSLSAENSMMIYNSTFRNNTSIYYSKCISFMGESLEIINSMFIENSLDLNEYEFLVDLEYGSALNFLGSNLLINNTMGIGNNGLKGGFLMIDDGLSEQRNILIENSYFTGNTARNGPVIYVGESVKNFKMIIRKNYFYQNNGWDGAVGFLKTWNKNFTFIVENNVFFKNYGILGGTFFFELLFGDVFFLSNVFLENLALTMVGLGGCFVYVGSLSSVLNLNGNKIILHHSEFEGTLANNGGIVECTNNLFYKNYGGTTGTIYIQGGGIVNLNDSLVIEDYSNYKSGSITSKDSSNFTIRNSLFKGCFSLELGGTFNLYERSSFQLINTHIMASKSSYGGIISSKEFAIISIYNCTFSQNFGAANLFDIIESTFLMENIIIKNNINNFLLALRSIITLNEIIITNHICLIVSQGCIIHGFGNTQITITSSSFENVQSIEKDNIFIHESSLTLSKASFSLTKTQTKKGSCLSGVDSNFQINSTSFSLFDGNAVFFENSSISLSNSFVIDHFNKSKLSDKNKFGGLVCLECYEIKIVNSSFVNNKGIKGAAIYLFDSGKIECKAKSIEGGLFQANEGEEEGGAIYLENQKIEMRNVNFSSNKASNGGAIFCVIAINLKNLSTIIENSIFINNYAMNDGGALKWLGLEPLVDNNNKFEGNIAFYGNDIACYGIKLRTDVYTNNEQYFSTLHHKEEINLKNISSGNRIQYKIVFTIIDIYNNTVKSAKGKIELKGEDFIRIEGENPKFFQEGIAEFNSLSFFWHPGKTIKILASSDLLKDEFTNLNLNLYPYEKLLNGTYYSIIKLDFRRCIQGEVFFNESLICYECPANKYSFSDGMMPSNCLACPKEAKTCYRNIIILEPDFWRASIDSDQIFSCSEFSQGCMGEYESRCSPGYEGPLCGSCMQNHASNPTNKKQCVECSDNKIISILTIAGVFFVWILLLFIFIYSSVKQSDHILQRISLKRSKFEPEPETTEISEALDSKNRTAVFEKLLLDYFQLLSIIRKTFDLNLPSFFQDYMNIFSVLGSLSSQNFSFKCLIYEYEINLKVIYLKTIFIAIFPLIAIFGAFFIVLKGKRERRMIRFGVVVIVVSIFFQPNIVDVMFENMICKKIGKQYVLLADFNLDCRDQGYKLWILSIVYPILAIWILVYPVACIYYIFKHKKKLNYLSVRAKVGFYVNGYKKNFFFWDFFIMSRKILFLSLNLFENFDIYNKLLVFLGLSYFGSLFTFACRPFVLKESNVIEYYSNIATTFVVFSGLVYLLTVNEILKIILFISAILVNIFFQINWGLRAVEIITLAHFEGCRRFCPNMLKKLFAVINTFKAFEFKIDKELFKKMFSFYTVLKGLEEVDLMFQNGKFNSEIKVLSRRDSKVERVRKQKTGSGNHSLSILDIKNNILSEEYVG